MFEWLTGKKQEPEPQKIEIHEMDAPELVDNADKNLIDATYPLLDLEDKQEIHDTNYKEVNQNDKS